jgi:hypothetical protein
LLIREPLSSLQNNRKNIQQRPCPKTIHFLADAVHQKHLLPARHAHKDKARAPHLLRRWIDDKSNQRAITIEGAVAIFF